MMFTWGGSRKYPLRRKQGADVDKVCECEVPNSLADGGHPDTIRRLAIEAAMFNARAQHRHC